MPAEDPILRVPEERRRDPAVEEYGVGGKPEFRLEYLLNLQAKKQERGSDLNQDQIEELDRLKKELGL